MEGWRGGRGNEAKEILRGEGGRREGRRSEEKRLATRKEEDR